MNVPSELARRWKQLRKAAILCRHPLWRRGLFHGVAATIEHRELAKYCSPRTVIDVGANKGQFALFARATWPDCRVISFEPLPGPAARFRAVHGRDPNVELHEIALGSASARLEMHITTREDSSSLLPVGERMKDVFPEVQDQGSRLEVPVERLDDVLDFERLPRPVLLKLDVQGYELEVLKGAGSSLSGVDCAYVECSTLELYEGQALSAEIRSILARWELSAVAELNRTLGPAGQVIQCDGVFMRK